AQEARRIGQDGKAAGDSVAGAMDKASHATKGAQDATKGLGGEMAGLMRAQMSLSIIQKVAGAITEQMNAAAEYTRKVGKEFIELRRTMQEVATLSGKPNTAQFTLEEARKAQTAHLTPQEYRDFKAQFLSSAGSQVGGPEG